MPIRVKHGIALEKPPAHVFAFLSDVDKMPQWQSTNFGVKEKTKAGGDGKLQRGTRVHDVRNVLGQEIEGEWEVVEHEKDRKLVLRVTKGPVPWEMTYTLEPLEGGGTWLTAEGGGELGKLPLSSVAASRACERLLYDDLSTLADILAHSGPGSGQS
jgi:uncharacterized protein YndB with AHSA1/START domain